MAPNLSLVSGSAIAKFLLKLSKLLIFNLHVSKNAPLSIPLSAKFKNSSDFFSCLFLTSIYSFTASDLSPYRAFASANLSVFSNGDKFLSNLIPTLCF